MCRKRPFLTQNHVRQFLKTSPLCPKCLRIFYPMHPDHTPKVHGNHQRRPVYYRKLPTITESAWYIAESPRQSLKAPDNHRKRLGITVCAPSHRAHPMDTLSHGQKNLQRHLISATILYTSRNIFLIRLSFIYLFHISFKKSSACNPTFQQQEMKQRPKPKS